jgi:hypothetical protein
MVTQRRKNVEDKTKVEASERLLSNNKKRLRASYVLIRNNVARMLQSRLCLIKKHNKLNYILLTDIFKYKLYPINN